MMLVNKIDFAPLKIYPDTNIIISLEKGSMAMEQIEKLIGERSYDIIKAHGGEIKVESKEGEGLSGAQTETEFIIQLPFV